jgi:hypothetical protein
MLKQHGRLYALMLAAGVLLTSPASAQTSVTAPVADVGLEAPIGKVVTATGSVTVEHKVAVPLQASASTGPAQAKVDDSVYQGDVVQTGTDSKLVLAFKDGSVFSLSSNGRMVLDQLVYDPKSSSNLTNFDLARGTLTFASGQVAKSGDMRVATPVGTMGIRGTTPRVQVLSDGSVKFSTLVEEKKAAAPTLPGNQQPKARPALQRRAQKAGRTMSPEQTATYNKVLNIDYKICHRC